MKVVVDVNVVVSSLINKGAAFEVFLTNRIFQRFEFVAPEFLKAEFALHSADGLQLCPSPPYPIQEA